MYSFETAGLGNNGEVETRGKSSCEGDRYRDEGRKRTVKTDDEEKGSGMQFGETVVIRTEEEKEKRKRGAEDATISGGGYKIRGMSSR